MPFYLSCCCFATKPDETADDPSKAEKVVQDILSGLKLTLKTLSGAAELIPVPGLSNAVECLIVILEAVEQVKGNVELQHLVASKIARIVNDIIQPAMAGGATGNPPSAPPPKLKARLSTLQDDLQKASKAAKNLNNDCWFLRLLRREDTDSQLRQLSALVDEALSRFNAQGVVNIEQELNDFREESRQNRRHDLAERLPHNLMARHDSDLNDPTPRCLDGTRTHIIQMIKDWFTDGDDKHLIFWLSGLAGSGKSTIAYTIAEYFDSQQQHSLGASYFFSTDRAELNQATLIFPTIAYQLTEFDDAFRRHITQSIEEHPMSANLALRVQLRYLIIDPLSKIDQRSSVLIILDGLDQCPDQRGAKDIIHLLGREISKLPFTVKVFLVSRPDPHISSEINELIERHGARTLSLQDDSVVDPNTVDDDITRYFKHHLKRVDRAWLGLEGEWPSEADILKLVQKARRLFIFASTAVKFICDSRRRRPAELLNTVLVSTGNAGDGVYRDVDMLYLTILKSFLPAGDSNTADLIDCFQCVMGTIVLLLDPLSAQALGALVELPPHQIYSVVEYMASVLLVPSSPTEEIRIFHPSFYEFITDSTRCRDERFHVNRSEHHNRIAKRCLQHMLRDGALKRDICQIGDPSRLNSELPDLAERIKKFIPRHLQYACLYWPVHVCLGQHDPELIGLLQSFCRTKLLHWLEVLSLLNRLDLAISGLQNVGEWYKVAEKDETTRLVSDAYRFALEFLDVTKINAAHIYGSALLFTPPCLLRELYSYELPSKMQIVRGQPSQWSHCLRVLREHTDEVYGVAVSPNNAYFASTSRDKTVRLWDANTGTCLKVYEEFGEANAVKFSSDSSLIVPACDDRWIRVLDVNKNICTHKLSGHEHWIYDVRFFPEDDTRLASASRDLTVRLWNLKTDTCTHVLEGHTDWVASVAISPDGKVLASGSHDRTVRIWKQSGDAWVCKLVLRGHTNIVRPVIFTLDGKRVISGSRDLRIWDASTGDCIRVLNGHSDTVRTLAISTDGLRVASGANDKTIRIWNIEAGACLSVLRDHTDYVYGLAFTPDGTRLVSGSRDSTIRIWEGRAAAYTHTEQGYPIGIKTFCVAADVSFVVTSTLDHLVQVWDTTMQGVCLDQLKGHENDVDVLAISSDGKQIVSGSKDTTIRVWQSHPWRCVHILRGHSDDIKALAFCTFHPSYLLSGSRDKTLRVWDKASGKEIKLIEHTSPVWAVEASPDGSRIAFGTHDSMSYDGVNWIHIWSFETGELVKELPSHKDALCSLAWTKNGEKLASGALDRIVRIWDANTWSCLYVLEGHSDPVMSLSFSPDGLQLISETRSLKHELFVWDVSSGRRLRTPRNAEGFEMDNEGWLWKNREALQERRRACWIPVPCRGWKTFTVSRKQGDRVLTFGLGVTVFDIELVEKAALH